MYVKKKQIFHGPLHSIFTGGSTLLHPSIHLLAEPLPGAACGRLRFPRGSRMLAGLLQGLPQGRLRGTSKFLHYFHFNSFKILFDNFFMSGNINRDIHYYFFRWYFLLSHIYYVWFVYFVILSVYRFGCYFL